MSIPVGTGDRTLDERVRKGIVAPTYGQTSVEEQRKQALEQLLRDAINGLFAPPETGYGIPSQDQLRQQAMSAIAPQYDAQIAQLRELMNQATQRTNRDKVEATQLYNALAGSYSAQVPLTQKRTKEQVAATEQNYQDLQNSIGSTYDDIQNQQAELFARLGIEAAAPSIVEDQLAEEARLKSLAATQGAAAKQREMSFGNADVAYMERGAPIARQTGANTVEDLMYRLDEYLKQQGTAISGIQSQKQGAITEYMNQLANQYAQSQSNAEAEQWRRGLDLIRILQEERDRIDRQEADKRKAQEPVTGSYGSKIATKTSGLSGAQNYLDNSGLDDISKQRVAQHAMNLINAAATRGNTTAEVVASQASSLQGLTPSEQVAVRNFILAYYGKF